MDGISLAGDWFCPSNGGPLPSVVIVVAGGGGIPAAIYQNFARYIAGLGAAVLTFDYRGISASRQGSLRNLRAGIEHWGVHDFGGALSLARSVYPALPLAAVAHSIGALLVGAAAGAQELSRLVLLGPHTGYYGDYRQPWRWPLYTVWHLGMPLVTKMVGYFPGRSLGLGEDLPGQVALDWARRRQPEIIATPEDQVRFAAILARYSDVRAETLAISISDDAFAPPRAATRLLELYPHIHALHEVMTPASRGRSRLGHFGFLRRPTAINLWHRVMAWILHQPIDGRASLEGASASGVPPSGTKEDALAGSTNP
jgi:predicted alpha/beta hydrolase